MIDGLIVEVSPTFASHLLKKLGSAATQSAPRVWPQEGLRLETSNVASATTRPADFFGAGRETGRVAPWHPLSGRDIAFLPRPGAVNERISLT
jgi:hypothetical protein